MKVAELLANIRNKEFNLEKRLEVKKYLPIEVKKTIAQGIIYDCTRDEGGVIKVDSVERYMSYVRYMITMHTNLEYTYDDYDTLCSTEYGDTTLLNAIMYCFGEDAKECSRILDLMMDDYMQEMTIEFTVAAFLNELNKSINDVSETINGKINSFDMENFDLKDIDRLSVFLEKYAK